jgi:hypothetical protein
MFIVIFPGYVGIRHRLLQGMGVVFRIFELISGQNKGHLGFFVLKRLFLICRGWGLSFVSLN